MHVIHALQPDLWGIMFRHVVVVIAHPPLDALTFSLCWMSMVDDMEGTSSGTGSNESVASRNPSPYVEDWKLSLSLGATSVLSFTSSMNVQIYSRTEHDI